MAHYKLHYFNLGGRGEFIRKILAQAGVEFEDHRITMEEWPQVKPSFPNGQVPVLEVDGKYLAQSYAIARFLARKHNLTGKDDWEAAKADMYVDGVEEVIQKTMPMVMALLFGKGDLNEVLAKLKPEVFEPFFTKYEKILHENGGEHFVGKQLTWADIMIADFLQRLSWVDSTVLDGHSGLKTFVRHIHDLPNIKKHTAAHTDMKW
uniref:glutathione transferase n=1 Tax=Plectus sambesii TaxID=2011161 RepID=A0A914WDM6_9BILA